MLVRFQLFPGYSPHWWLDFLAEVFSLFFFFFLTSGNNERDKCALGEERKTFMI